jgi:hypothetical protein
MPVRRLMAAAQAEEEVPARHPARVSVQVKGRSLPNKGELVPGAKAIQAGAGPEPDRWVEFLREAEKLLQKRAAWYSRK